MRKKENIVNAQAENRAIEELKSLNSKLLRQATDHRMQVKQLRQDLGAAAEMIETATAEIRTKEMQLLAVDREIEEKKNELTDLKERYLSFEGTKKRDKGWKKWLFPVGATAAISIGVVLVTMCCSNSKSKS